MTDFARLMNRAARVVNTRLSDAECVHNGQTFSAIFAVADREAFDVIVGDYTIRYLAADASLEPEAIVTINGEAYVVMGHPERINAHELSAPLMRAS